MDSSARSASWELSTPASESSRASPSLASSSSRRPRGKSSAPPDSGAFCERFELAPPPQPPPPAVRLLLSGLTFAASDNFEIEGYVAGFGNPNWKRTQMAASRAAVAIAMLRKQGGHLRREDSHG